MKKLLISLGLTAVFASISTVSLAAPVNLSTWLVLGDAIVSSTTAKLTTAFSSEAALGSGAIDINLLESQLSTPSGTLGLNIFEGSALTQSFSLVSSSTLSFNWTLATDMFNAGFADLAFVLVDGTLLLPLANVSAQELSGGFGYSFNAGTHTLAFGVVDVNDVDGVSTLSVSNLNLVSVTAVSEPGTLALMLMGLAGLGLRVARSKPQSH